MPTTTDATIKQKVVNALNKFFERDSYLLDVQANERSLTHRLAVYLQDEFEEFDVDCEYNRNGNVPKQLFKWARATKSDDLDGVTVYPDIIVHKRDGENHLIIEAKKSSNSNRDDIPKLEAYKAELGYSHAAFVIFPVGTTVVKGTSSYVKMY